MVFSAETSVRFLELSVEVASAYVSSNVVPPSEVPELIGTVHSALTRMVEAPPEQREAPPKPAVPVRRSVADDHIVCLEDGKHFKSLKRHLLTRYGMTPADYRAKWGLPADYPMVAPAYARARSLLAKEVGLGQRRRRG